MKYVGRQCMWTQAIGVLMVALVGCVSTPPPASTDTLFESREFHAPLNTPLTAQTGDKVFVEGTYIRGEVMTLSQDVSIMLPGSMHIPFPVTIAKGQLRMAAVRGGWKYFCAKEGEATASFPGFGSVIAKGDCVGARQSTLDGSVQWVVDNSNYNRTTTIWARAVEAEQRSLLKRSTTDEPFAVKDMKRIIFDGSYGGQFHFTFEEWMSATDKQSKEFVFDRNSAGPTMVGIHGKIFRIIGANNIEMTYEWVNI